jgi:putative toxin-antitoxin system antitoxin component (TIGR02293 family)
VARYDKSRSAVSRRRTAQRLARIIALAESLWDDEHEARAFLNRPHPLLDGETPLEASKTELGTRRVERLLHAIEHGLPL